MGVVRVETFKLPTETEPGQLNGRAVVQSMREGWLYALYEDGEECELLTEAIRFRSELSEQDVHEQVSKLTEESLAMIQSAGNAPAERLFLELAIMFLNSQAEQEILLRRLRRGF